MVRRRLTAPVARPPRMGAWKERREEESEEEVIQSHDMHTLEAARVRDLAFKAIELENEALTPWNGTPTYRASKAGIR